MSKIYASLKAASEDKENDSVAKSVPTFMLDPRAVQIKEGFNARPIDPEHVAYMQALQEAGVDTGFIIVQMIDGKPYLRDGHHRLTATMNRIAAGAPVLKVKALEFKGDERAAIFMMLATQSGKPYTPMQLGEQYNKLVNSLGMTFSEIAKERGMSTQHVRDCIRLTEQPVELKEMIQAGTIAPAVAMKLVRQEGASEAVKTIKEAAVTAPKKGITQKVINNLAKNVVSDAKKRASTASEHIAAMLDSPGFDGPTKAALRDVLALIEGKTQRIAAPKTDPSEFLASWLETHRCSTHSDVKRAAYLMTEVMNNKPLPVDSSQGAQFYSNMVWLQDMAANTKDPKFRAAAHWFFSVMNAKRTGHEVAPAPSVLSLEDALLAEMDGGGHVLAETLCPEQAALIMRIRGRA